MVYLENLDLTLKSEYLRWNKFQVTTINADLSRIKWILYLKSSSSTWNHHFSSTIEKQIWFILLSQGICHSF